jgi:hypothetical protein
VKHFKNSQQIDYTMDHGISYTDREINSPSFFLHISQMLNVSTFGNTADIYTIVHFVPHASAYHGRRSYLLLLVLSPSGKSGQTRARAFPLKKTWKFTLYRHKNYHDPLRSLFVANF